MRYTEEQIIHTSALHALMLYKITYEDAVKLALPEIKESNAVVKMNEHVSRTIERLGGGTPTLKVPYLWAKHIHDGLSMEHKREYENAIARQLEIAPNTKLENWLKEVTK